MNMKNLSPFFIVLAILIGSTAATRLMAQPKHDFDVNMLIGNYSVSNKNYEPNQINRVSTPQYTRISFGPNGIVTVTTMNGIRTQSTYEFNNRGAVMINPPIYLTISLSRVDKKTNKIQKIYTRSENLRYQYDRE